MKAFLDLNGLTTFWGLVKQYIDTSTSAAQVEMQVVSSLPTTGTQGVIYLIANSDSTEDENVYDEYVYVSDTGTWEKLGAFFSLPVATATTLGGVMVGTSLSIDSNGVLSVKAATTSQAGTMSASDKTKLDGIESGAEANQNAFSNVVVGSTTLAADSTTDTLTIAAGDNITLTPTASSDSFVIAATDTTYDEATTSTAGLMSASDKAKLDSITESASSVSVTQNATSGNAVATITINGTSTTLYAAEETEAIADSDIEAIFE